MQLNFSMLAKARVKQMGHPGKRGTTSTHEGICCPTPATIERDKMGQAATTAGILSHLTRQTKGESGHGMPSVLKPVPPVPPVPFKTSDEDKTTADRLEQVLSQFRFDEGQERLNNMTYEFMTVDGMTYAHALRIASEVVRICAVASCEAAYKDVQALWRSIVRNRQCGQ